MTLQINFNKVFAQSVIKLSHYIFIYYNIVYTLYEH